MTDALYELLYLLDSFLTITAKAMLIAIFVKYFSSGLNISTWRKN